MGGSTHQLGASQSGVLARYAFVYRAVEWRHKSVELAAHELLQRLDRIARIT